MAGSPSLQIDNAIVPLRPPGSNAMAAYMVIINTSDQNKSIESVHAVGFGMAHFHKSENHDGMAHMVAMDSIDIPAGGTVALEPGALHIMLMKPEIEALSSGTVELVFTLEDGEEIKTSAQVLTQE